MKKVLFILAVIALAAAWAYAADQAPANRDEACKILGNCGDDMISAAEMMRAQCAKMIDTAKSMMDKGMKIKTQGQVWGDKDMIAEGDKLYADGKKMMEEAQKMDEQCKIIIEEGKKKKAAASDYSKQPKDKNPKGDMF